MCKKVEAAWRELWRFILVISQFVLVPVVNTTKTLSWFFFSWPVWRLMLMERSFCLVEDGLLELNRHGAFLLSIAVWEQMMWKLKEFLPLGEWNVIVDGWRINWDVYNKVVPSKILLLTVVKEEQLGYPESQMSTYFIWWPNGLLPLALAKEEVGLWEEEILKSSKSFSCCHPSDIPEEHPKCPTA